MAFYVYELIDPRDGSVFYVGKGIGGRAHQHLRDALAGRIGNETKHARIRDILDAGVLPVVCIAGHFDDEHDALAFEAARIEAIGLENLTNIRPSGAASAGQSVPETARRIIATAEADIRAARSPESVEFARDFVEVGSMLLAKHAEHRRTRWR